LATRPGASSVPLAEAARRGADREPEAGALGVERGPRAGTIWLAFFGYTLAMGLLVQLVVLPRLFPSVHWGQGLLYGSDSVAFHQMAVRRAARIRQEGWTAWEVRPYGQAPAGVASAIYALTVPAPWTLMPVNAAVHATAALVLLGIVERFVRQRHVALLATLPFVLYPSAMTWYTQLHKDGWFILGALLVASGWLGLARRETWTRGGRAPARSAAAVLLGALLVWIMRPYGALLLQALGVLLALLLTAVFGARAWTAALPWRRALAGAAAGWLMVGGFTVLANQEVPVAEYFSVEPELRAAPTPEQLARWQPWPWLPAFLDYRLRELAAVRDNYRSRYPRAGSNVDADVSFRSPGEVLAYLPRAAVVMFLAPFPTHWTGAGSTPAGTLMRPVAALEMLGLYLALALLPYAIWRWRRRVELYVLGGYCLGMMLVYATAVMNVGALYRFRYGFVMTLAALGIAGALGARRPSQAAAEGGEARGDRRAHPAAIGTPAAGPAESEGPAGPPS
jgi:hypothetical protein